MGPFVAYILKSAIVLTVFYSLFALLMSRETLHRINRIALLLMMVASFVVPSIHVTISTPTTVNHAFVAMDEAFLVGVVSDAGTGGIEWADVVVAAYVAGLALFGVATLFQFASLMVQLRRGDRFADELGNTLLVRNESVSPFSFMRFIIVGRADVGERSIIVHEQEHIRLRHSWDIILLRTVQTIQWFNPFVWLLGRDLQTIHEYEADKAVMERGVSINEYQQLLIKKAVGNRLQSFANNLNQSSLKKRFTMMYSKKSSKWATAKYLMVLPVLTATVAVMARPELATAVSTGIEQVAGGKVSKIIPTEQAKTPETVVQELPVQSNDTATVVSVESVGEARKITLSDAFDASKTHVFINGKEVSAADFSAIDPSMISSMEIIRDRKLLSKLGISDGKDAIQIRTKDNSESAAAKKDKAAEACNPAVVFDFNDKDVFSVVEHMPEFPGGGMALMKFLADNVTYPKEAVEAKTEGRVLVGFTVNEDGTIADVAVKRGVSPAVDAEAVRVINLMPKWTPGQQNGKNVKVRYIVPVTFSLR